LNPARLLSVEDLRSGYGPIEALRGVSLEVRPGEIVTLVGANGAGKTTLLMTISGLIRARGGRIRFDGAEITGRPSHEITRRGIGQSPEGRKIFPRLSVLENLEMGAFTRPDRGEVRQTLEHCFELFPILKERRSQAGGTLSGGEQQMLAIARALMAKPRLLLLDEPSLGLAPMLVIRIFEAIRDLNRQGMAILLVEQNAKLALTLAHRGYVMETGRIILADEAAKLLADPRVKEAYLGEG
jgi:branched-chain amino acid transport system ATP-binding protein